MKKRMYNVWHGMKDRCYNPSNQSFHRYGGRGIEVCAEWRNDYARFEADMGPRPPKHSLDRIDNDGNYEPSNCRWADAKTQSGNKSPNFVSVRLEEEDWAALQTPPACVYTVSDVRPALRRMIRWLPIVVREKKQLEDENAELRAVLTGLAAALGALETWRLSQLDEEEEDVDDVDDGEEEEEDEDAA